MRRILLVFVCAGVILTSCQKEVSFDDTGGGPGGGNSSSGLLIRSVSKNGSDSTVTTYLYDADKRIVNEKLTGMSQGIDVSNEMRYYRNSNGVMTRYVQVNALLSQAGIDSVTTYVYYNTSTSRYTHTISEVGAFGFSIKDSTVLVYDQAGKVIRTDVYENIPLLGSDYDLTLKTTYTYASGGNVGQIDIYDPTSGSDELVATGKYTYDTKVNPLIMGQEAFVLGRADVVSANNPVKIEIMDLVDPSNNVTVTMSYDYNTENKPVKGTAMQNPGNIVEELSMYYQ